MKRITLTFLLVLIATLGIAQTQESTSLQTHKRIKINATNHAAIHRMANLSIDLRCGAHHSTTNLTIDIANEELDILRANNISYQIIIDDLNQFYRDNSTRDLATAQIEFRREREKSLAFRNGLSQRSSVALNTVDNYLQSVGAEEIDWNVPLNYPDVTSTSEVPMGGSLTVSQVLTELDEMRAYALSKGLILFQKNKTLRLLVIRHGEILLLRLVTLTTIPQILPLVPKRTLVLEVLAKDLILKPFIM